MVASATNNQVRNESLMSQAIEFAQDVSVVAGINAGIGYVAACIYHFPEAWTLPSRQYVATVVQADCLHRKYDNNVTSAKRLNADFVCPSIPRNLPSFQPWAVQAALTMPAKMAANKCFQKLFGCNGETTARNIAATVAANVTSAAAAAVVANQLGYGLDWSEVAKVHVCSEALSFAVERMVNRFA